MHQLAEFGTGEALWAMLWFFLFFIWIFIFITVVMDIFPAREEPIPGVTGATISDLIPLPPDRVVYEPRYGALPETVAALARPGDLVVTMGIGNVYLLCDEIRDACGRASTSSEFPA